MNSVENREVSFKSTVSLTVKEKKCPKKPVCQVRKRCEFSRLQYGFSLCHVWLLVGGGGRSCGALEAGGGGVGSRGGAGSVVGQGALCVEGTSTTVTQVSKEEWK